MITPDSTDTPFVDTKPEGEPSGVPSEVASEVPSGVPSEVASGVPSEVPSGVASEVPSGVPSEVASGVPSGVASEVPSGVPSGVPSEVPPGEPSGLPSVFLPTPDASIMPGVRGMLGLCARARKLVLGTGQVCEALHRAADVKIVFEASDTSANTHKRLCDRCTFYGVPLVRLPDDGFTLGHAVGKDNLSAVAVTDEQFARAIRMKMNPQPNKKQSQ